MAPSNALPIHGNEKTMNLNHLILTNIQSSPYFKVNLYELKTYHEVIDEIYYKVDHLEPWEKGSRKTAGQTGMCGGVRGVGAGGIVSSAYCLLYKLFTLKLTRKQLNGLITHTDSAYIRGLGFMYIRYTQPPADLWDYFGKYLEDDEELDVKAGGGQLMTIGELCRQWLFKIEWYSTLFPRIPVPVQKMIQMKLREYDAQHAREPMAELPEDVGEAEGFEGEGEQEPNYGQAERMSRNQGSDREADRGERENTKDREINRDRESNRGDRDSNRGDREKDRGHRESSRVDRESNRDRGSDRESNRGDRERDRGSDRERDRERDRGSDRERDRGSDRERDRGSDRERDRGSDRERDRGDRGSNRGDRGRDRGDRERGRGDRERERDRDRYQQPGGFDVAQEIQREKERQRKEKERGSRERDRGSRDKERDRHREDRQRSRERNSNDAKGRERREVSPSYERRDRYEKGSWTPERPQDNHRENRDPERLERKRSHSQEHKRSRSHERKKSKPEEGRQSRSPEHREKKEKHKHKHKHKSKSGDKEQSKSKRDKEEYRNGKH